MKLFLVIPAFNEEGRIGTVLGELIDSKLPIIVVDDGSKDRTFDEIKRFPVIALHHKINLGKGAALKTGCEAAFKLGAEAILMMDSDGQHLSSDMNKFIKKLEEGYDIVYGSRNFNKDMPMVRHIGNKIASIMVAVMFGLYISDLLCGFRAFSKNAYQKIKWVSTGYGVETEIAVLDSKARLRRIEVPIETVYHDNFKGVSILDAFGIFYQLVCWRISR